MGSFFLGSGQEHNHRSKSGLARKSPRRSFRIYHRWVRVLCLLCASVMANLLPMSESIGKNGPYAREGHDEARPLGRPPRIAVCFFGLTRSLRWTLPSIKTRLLNVLQDAGMEVEVFLHTYHLAEVNNTRAGEEGIKYAPFAQDYKALNATRSLVTDQDEFDRLWPDPLSLSYFDWRYPPHLIHGVVRNVFRAYWSIATVSSMMELYALENGILYDGVVLARPDVWFHVDTDLPGRQFPLPDRTVFLPNYEMDQIPGGRKNDRFAYGCPSAMRVLMKRIETFMDPSAGLLQGQRDSEGVFGYHLHQHQIEVQPLDFPVTRVRLTGQIPRPDHKRVTKACESGDDPMACEMVRLDFNFPIEGGGASSSSGGPD